MTDIFISYKKEDAGRVIRLVEGLRAEGFSVWWDHGIQAGSEWDKSIHRELQAAKVVIAIWSESSVGAPWVKEEATVGKNRGILLPVRIDKVDPPLGFMMIQAADLVGWRGDRKDQRWSFFLDAVRAILGGEARLATEAPVQHRPPAGGLATKLAIAVVAVVLLLIGGVVAWNLTREKAPPLADRPQPAPMPVVALPPPTAAPAAAPLPTQTAAPPAAAAVAPNAATTLVPAAAPTLAPAPAPPQITANEQKLWDKALEEKNRQGFQSYLLAYPSGAYANRARDILLTCRTETRETWKHSPIGANQTARGVGDTSKGTTAEQACAKAKADVRTQAKQICDTITTNGGYRNADLTLTDVPCTCNKTSATITVCVADVPYSCQWEMKVAERVETCGG